MTNNHSLRPSSDRRIALLIDADNISHHRIAAIIAELSKYGTANIRRAYGNWASNELRGWTDKLHSFAIRPIQQFSYTVGKNATDIALVIDAMELLYTQRLDGFCLVTSDADFTPLVMQLKASGQDVYGFGDRKTPGPFVNACSTFLYLDGLDEPTVETTATAREGNAVGVEDDRASTGVTTSENIAADEQLVSVLRGAVEATAREDGWAPLASVGHAIKRQAPIDPRNYGVRNFTALFEAVGLFDIKRADSGHPFVADRRNKDRAPYPGG